jgi:hypothetical protein
VIPAQPASPVLQALPEHLVHKARLVRKVQLALPVLSEQLVPQVPKVMPVQPASPALQALLE